MQDTIKVHKSKIGPEVAIPIMLILGIILFVTVIVEKRWAALLILLPVIFLRTHLFLTTKYTIHGNILKIKCGFLFNKEIDIHTIRKISETNNPLSSPAASLDRLEIVFGANDTVLISPKNKEAFIKDITSVNAAVEIKLKNK